jgi:hypothetical protein
MNNSETSSIEVLKVLAKRENWTISIDERIINARYGHTQRSVLIKNPQYPDLYFISEHKPDYAKNNFYSGIFCPLRAYNHFSFHLRKRDVLDKLNFRKNKLRFKTGNSEFDSKVLITTNNEIEMHKLLCSSGIQYDLLDFLKSDNLFNVGLNEIHPDFDEELKEKNYLSVFVKDEWLLDKNLIQSSYKIAQKLFVKLNNT